jgi:hypothetical protein
LTTNEVVKDKDNDQRRHVANQFDVRTAKQPIEQTLTDAAETHYGSQNNGQDGTPDTEAKSSEKPLHDEIGYPFAALLVVTIKILGYGLPVPFVIQSHSKPVAQIDYRSQEESGDNQVKRGSSQSQFVVIAHFAFHNAH